MSADAMPSNTSTATTARRATAGFVLRAVLRLGNGAGVSASDMLIGAGSNVVGTGERG